MQNESLVSEMEHPEDNYDTESGARKFIEFLQTDADKNKVPIVKCADAILKDPCGTIGEMTKRFINCAG